MVMLSGSSSSTRSTAADHAGDQVDVDLREAEAAGEGVGAGDLRRAMGAAVQLEDVIVEVLDTEAQARHADVTDHRQLRLGQRTRLALEGHFLGAIPWR